MKNLILILALLCPTIAFAQESHDHKSHSNIIIKENGYHCSMHKEITGERTDRCSICGMFLVKNKDDTSSIKMSTDNSHSLKLKLNKQEKDTYVCPMNSNITSDKKERCHKCGMFLVKKEKEFKTHSMKSNIHNCKEHKSKDGSCSKCKEHEKKNVFKSNKHNCSESNKKDCAKCSEHIEDKYVCPMHSDITSDKKGRCPKCGMFLKSKNNK
jgi:Cu(I)/Ag(I) efflux system membrane fusion protein